jgi:hypothetical protein
MLTAALAALICCVAAVPAGAAGAAGAPAQSRYSLVHGCYAVSAGGRPLAGAERVRMQATDLGKYLLYTPDAKFVASRPDGSTGVDATPSEWADWQVAESGAGTFTMQPVAGSAADALQDVRFTAASGCAEYPEAGVNATGTPSSGATSYGKVGGLLEGHMHWMTYQFLGGRFHCGKPWDKYGIPYALPDCSSIEGPQGLAAPIQNFLNYDNPLQPHDTAGYPTLASWTPTNLTYEGTYWKWVQRAWMAGLRMMVMSPNENRILCLLQTNRDTNCDEMDTVRRSLQAIHQLQDYVDAQSGGPGRGFFQIVTNPEDARRVINQGRMAVLLEVEVSEPFDCAGTDGRSTCDTAKVDAGLDELYGLGVRSMLLLNKFDNPLVGVRFDSGPVGVLINAANFASSGSFWSARTCTGALHDNDIYTPSAALTGSVGTLLSSSGLPGGLAPVPPPAPDCNTRGLTDLGAHVVERMMDRHMIVNPDHMSQAGVDRTLSLLEARNYSGVISPHGWMDPGNWPRIWRLGGMAFPGHSEASSYVQQWQQYRPKSTPYMLGWGYGADMGGLSEQPAASADGGITYPFRSMDGKVTFDRETTGSRTFDYNKDGVATYGQYADWFADLQKTGGPALVKDMWNGAEAYLEMWERTDGIRATSCDPSSATVSSSSLGALKIGASWTSLLSAAGQPQQRDRAWSYCASGSGNEGRADVAELSQDGTVELVGSTASGRSANGVSVGSPASTVTSQHGIKTAGPGIYYNNTWVYATRSGVVTAIATASPALTKDPTSLSAAMSRLSAATATQSIHPTFTPSDTQAAQEAAGTPITGQPLAAATNAQVTSALAALCHLQL